MLEVSEMIAIEVKRNQMEEAKEKTICKVQKEKMIKMKGSKADTDLKYRVA